MAALTIKVPTTIPINAPTKMMVMAVIMII